MVGFVKSMKDTEPLTGVKITTMCPGAVTTPLFDAAKIKQFSVDPERLLTPETCATHMLDLLQSKKYPCGSVSEITLSGTRLIPKWNVAPPHGQGTGQEEKDSHLIANMLEPIVKILESEKPRL